MADEETPVKDVKEAVVPDAEETTPDKEVIPPVVNDEPEDDIRSIVNEVRTRVDELTEAVASLAPNGPVDTKPVKKPWTHWGSR